MFATCAEILSKITFEVLHDRVLPFLSAKDGIRLAVAKTWSTSENNFLVLCELLLDLMAYGSSEVIISSESAVSWFQKFNVRLSHVRFGCGIANKVLVGCQLARRARTLSLNGCTKLTPSTMANFIADCQQIQKLDLTLCTFEPSLSAAICTLHNLTALDLSMVTSITHEQIIEILDSCTNLRRLCLHGCSQLTAVSLNAIAPHCGALEVIDLSQITNADGYAISAVCHHAHNLRELNVRSCGHLNHTMFASMADSCSLLEKLDFSYPSYGSIGNESLHALSMCCKNITEFKANGHRGLTQISVQTLVQECRSLVTLELADTGINDQALFVIAENCLHLKSLNASNTRISDAGVITIATCCTMLTRLLLKGCAVLTEGSVTAIARSCFHLQELSVSHCGTAVTDAALILLAHQCTSLEVLNISVSPNLTDEGVIAVAAHCSKLTWLGMHNCPKVTDVSIVELFLRCSKLKVVQAFKCGISVNTMRIYGL